MTMTEWLLEGLFLGIFCELGVIMSYHLILLTPVFHNLSQYRMDKITSRSAINWFTVGYFLLIGFFFELLQVNSGNHVLSTNFIILIVIMLIGIIDYWQDLLVVGLLTAIRLLMVGIGDSGFLQLGIGLAFVLGLMLIRAVLTQKTVWLDFGIQSVAILIFWVTFFALGVVNIVTVFQLVVQYICLLGTFYLALKLIYQDNELMVVLSRNASHDYLTGLLNQRMYEADFRQQLAVAKQKATPLSLIAFDIDYFKDINDHHGHDAGNQVLVEVATIIKQISRSYQSGSRLYRVGGEEFNLVLPNLDQKSAERVALRCCQMVSHSGIQYHGAKIPVTLSAGISDFTKGDTQIIDLYLRADRNLYLSKQRGRNRVTVNGATMVADQ